MGTIRLDVLGPLRVTTDDVEVVVPGAKQRLLAAVLTTGAGEQIGTAVLVDALWPARRPEDPQHALQNLVSRLRNLLSPGGVAVQRQGEGYRFHDTVRIDAVRYRQLVDDARRAREAGRPVEALDLLTAAEELWRGRPYEDVPEARVLASEAASLEQLHRAAHDQRFDLALESGRHSEVVRDLQRLVFDDPLDERRSGQLMLALARSGRQAEALTVYEQLRRNLNEELGADPGPQLQQLHVAILRGSPDVLAVATVSPTREASGISPEPSLPPPLVPSTRQPLVGRQRQISALADLWSESVSGSGRLALLEGEPGAGKTRLLAAIAEHVRRGRSPVLFGRCDEGGAVPYQPFAEALGDLEAPADGSGSSRRRLFDRTLGDLEARCAEAPVLLLIDDLHWATTPTLLMLRHIVRWGATLPLLLVATVRDRGADVGHAESALLAELQADPSVHRIPVGPLELADVRELLEEYGCDHARAVEIHSRTGGNAFFVREVIRGGSDSSEVHEMQVSTSGVPQRVSALVQGRRARLSAAANRLLECAAVAGESFDLRVVGPASGLDDPILADAVDDAVVAGFLELRSGTRSCAFVHALVREAVLEGLNPVRRQQLHGDLLDALEAVGHHRLDEVAASLAHHAAEAERWSRARTYAALAGDVAVRTYAWEDAAAHYREAVEANRRSDDPVAPAALLLKLADAERRAANSATALEVYREAFDAARARDTPRALALAAIGFEDTRGEETYEDHAEPSRRMLRTALQEMGDSDPDLEAELLARLAIADTAPGSTMEEADAMADRALDHARVTGDPALMVTALEASYRVHWTLRGLDRRLAIAEELEHITHRLDDRRALRARVLRAAAYLSACDRDRFELALAGYEEEARRVAESWYLWWIRAFDGTRAILDGDLAALGAVIDELAPSVQGRQQLELVGLFSTVLSLEQGHPDLYRPLVEGWTAVLQSGATDPSHAHAALALFTALVDEEDTASQHLAQVSFDRLATGLNGGWGLAFMGLAAAELWDHEAAHQVHQRLVAYPRQAVVIGALTPLTTTSYVLCRLAEVLGDLPAAVAHAEDAERCAEAVGAVTWGARARYHHARLLLRDSSLRDPTTARDLADRAAREARRVGMHGLVQLADEIVDRGPAA